MLNSNSVISFTPTNAVGKGIKSPPEANATQSPNAGPSPFTLGSKNPEATTAAHRIVDRLQAIIAGTEAFID